MVSAPDGKDLKLSDESGGSSELSYQSTIGINLDGVAGSSRGTPPSLTNQDVAANESQLLMGWKRIRLKLCDFGLSQCKENLPVVENKGLIGSYGYFAPELILAS